MFLDEMAAKAFGVSSFTVVGHLLHINLKENLLAHKYEIGKALLANNNRAVAVVNKINSIDNEYRNFDIEVIAKRDDCTKNDEELMLVEVNENKCRFQMDFSKVYWNSRLSTEHERIINKLNKVTDIVFDLFAGVGPFAVPAAKAKCKTYANDLNPESIKWLQINMKRNKVQPNMYEIFNIDAKDFIINEMKTKLIEEYNRIEEMELATKPNIHIIMNLPALAPTFLPHFIGLFKGDRNHNMVNDQKLHDLFREQSLEHIVHCYCFLKGAFENPRKEVLRMIEEQIGRELNDDQLIDIFRVRNVAPFKEMYRVDFRLDSTMLFEGRSIMRNPSSHHMINSSKKQVTINAPTNGLKRSHEESSVDSSSSSLSSNGASESSSKRAKYTDYCTVM